MTLSEVSELFITLGKELMSSSQFSSKRCKTRQNCWISQFQSDFFGGIGWNLTLPDILEQFLRVCCVLEKWHEFNSISSIVALCFFAKYLFFFHSGRKKEDVGFIPTVRNVGFASFPVGRGGFAGISLPPWTAAL